MPIDHQTFIGMLAAEFPEVAAQINEYEAGLLHCEVGAFRRATEHAMDAGRLWEAERHFRFLERALQDAGPEVENALEVSYIEDLALGECTPGRLQAVKERMPRWLQTKVISHSDNWR